VFEGVLHQIPNFVIPQVNILLPLYYQVTIFFSYLVKQTTRKNYFPTNSLKHNQNIQCGKMKRKLTILTNKAILCSSPLARVTQRWVIKANCYKQDVRYRLRLCKKKKKRKIGDYLWWIKLGSMHVHLHGTAYLHQDGEASIKLRRENIALFPSFVLYWCQMANKI